MTPKSLPRWISIAALFIMAAQFVAGALLAAGQLPGPARNLVFQTVLGGMAGLFMLGAYILKFHPDRLPLAPAGAAVWLLTLLSAVLTAGYFLKTNGLLTLPYDLGSWSEPMFLVEVLKWRTGTPVYLAPEENNTGTYTFGAPALTYLLAKLAGRADSIVSFRWIQQLYLLASALLTAFAAMTILRLLRRGEQPKLARAWVCFFTIFAFLFTVNPQTGAFNIYLHNDPLALAVSMLAFYALVKHAETQSMRWLGIMAVLPTAGFLVKQYLAVWAPVYAAYLLLSGEGRFRRVILFSAVSFGLLGATLAASYLAWGENFVYWVFTIMGQHIVSLEKMVGRTADAAPFLLPGVAAGLLFWRGNGNARLQSIWAAWLVLLFGGLYTSGITYSPTHLGPAAQAGLAFGFAALALIWPEGDVFRPRAEQWARLSLNVTVVLLTCGAFGFLTPQEFRVTPDLRRYVTEIENEFEAMPAEAVLLDSGDWVYFQKGVLARDRHPILVTHRGNEQSGFVERVRQRQYARLLVHVYPNEKWSFDMSRDRGLQEHILRHYREVRRIGSVRGMQQWRYAQQFFSEIVVLEPIGACQP